MSWSLPSVTKSSRPTHRGRRLSVMRWRITVVRHVALNRRALLTSLVAGA